MRLSPARQLMSPKSFKILFIIAEGQAEKDVRRKLADIRSATFSVATADNLAHAFTLLNQISFDVFLVDPAVPDYQGIDSLRRLILAASEAPVIVISNSYDEAQAIEAVRAGAEDYTVASRMNSSAFERVIIYSIERRLTHQRIALQFSVSRVLAGAATIRDAADGILGTLCEFAKVERGQVWQSDAARWKSRPCFRRSVTSCFLPKPSKNLVAPRF